MKNIVSILFIFLISYEITAQVLYSGPSQGVTTAGITVNTDNFLTYQNNKPVRFRLFANQNVADIDNILGVEQPLAPEGSNLYLNGTSRTKSLTRDEVIMFTGFEGIEEGNSIPPDPYVAVGPNHIVQTVNSAFRITDKNGNNVKTIDGDSWYNSIYPGASVFDPKIAYDHFSNRWIMVWLDQNDATSEGVYLLSVSDDDDPNGIWFNWVLNSNVNGSTPANSWGDYQGVGYDDKAIYLTSNQFTFTGSSVGAKIRIIAKEQAYVSSNPGTLKFTDLYNVTYPTGGVNAFGIRPVRMQTASDAFYFAVHSSYNTKTNFGIYKLENPITNPVLTGVAVPVTAYSTPPDPDQLGGGTPRIDGGGTNLRNEPVFKDDILHLTHSVRVGSYSGVHYLAVNTLTNSVIYDMVIGDENHYHTYPAIAISGDDDVMLTYSKSSSSMYMGAYFTVIPSATGIPSESIELHKGLGNYVKTFSGTRNRWGDYNGAWTDPSNPDNFYVFTEYVGGTNSWACWLGGVRIKPYAEITAAFNKKEIDFSFSEINLNSDTAKVKIINHGAPNLVVTNIQSSNPKFAILNNLTYPITLGSFEAVELSIVFTPDQEKEYLDSIIVTSNDVNEPNKSIHLKGIGYKISSPNANVFYSTSGSSSACKIITVDPTNGQSTLIGQSNVGKLYSLAIRKETKQLYSLVGLTPYTKIARIDGLTGNGVIYKDLDLTLKAIAFDKDDVLYGVSDDNKLYTINVENSTYEMKANLSLSVNAMTFDPITNLLWASTDSTINKDRLYTIDVKTGTVSLVGATTFNNLISALAFDKDNNLYGLILKTFLRGMLVKIDKATGVATELGTTNYVSTLGLAILSDTTTSVNSENSDLSPKEYTLLQNYPNPFNPSTTINFNLPVNANVKLSIFNVLGEEVQVLVNQNLNAGNHSVIFNSKSLNNKELTSGMYMYTLKAIGNNGSEFIQTKKMLLIK